MEKNLFAYVWRHTKRQQIWILIVILASLPFYFMSLELPKRIVNGPIQGSGFEQPGATETFLQIQIDVPSFISSQPLTLFPGIEMERLPYLIALSLLFLGLVCVNGLFKFYINTYKGRLGERMLRRLRFELVDRVLRFPMPYFRKVKASEIATMVKDEVEPLGGFIGDAFVSPAFFASQALTAMAFILVQNVWLGSMALAIVLAQAVVIPRLRKRLLVLGKQQQLTARELAGRIGELVDGVVEVRVNDTSNYERADVASRLGRIFFIRFELYQRKFFVKFLNNFLSQVTPFMFYLVGGYFAIRGSLDIGQLVAVIAAYKDLPAPIREIINWDQARQDVQIKYTQVAEQFAPDTLVPSELQTPHPGPVPHLKGIEVHGLSLVDETGANLVERADLAIAPGERVAAVGEVNSGAESVGEALARLIVPASGRIRVGGKSLEEMPEAVLGRRLAYVGPDPYLRNGTLRDALEYGLRHFPQEGSGPERREIDEHEAEASGNTTLDIEADWIDYHALGGGGHERLERRLHAALELVDLNEDVFELGLRSRPMSAESGDFAERILRGRAALMERLAAPDLEGLVEPFEPEHYNNQATVGENLLFGAPIDATFATENLARNRFILKVLTETGLGEELFAMGTNIAKTVLDLFDGLPPDHHFFEQLSFMRSEDLPVYQTVLARVSGKTFVSAAPDDRAMILGLAFGYIEPRHRLDLLTDDLRQRIVAARRIIHESLPDDDRGAIAFYDPAAYNAGSTLEDNILFGRMAYGIADGPRRVREVVRDVLKDPVLQGAIFEAGLAFNVGSGGKRLVASQRQKVGLARALLKGPELLIVNRCLNTLSSRLQREIIDRVLEAAKGGDIFPPFAVFWVLNDPTLAEGFDRVLMFHAGRITEERGVSKSTAGDDKRDAKQLVG